MKPDQLLVQFKSGIPRSKRQQAIVDWRCVHRVHTSIATIKTMMLEQDLLFKPIDTRQLIEKGLLPPAQEAWVTAP